MLRLCAKLLLDYRDVPRACRSGVVCAVLVAVFGMAVRGSADDSKAAQGLVRSDLETTPLILTQMPVRSAGMPGQSHTDLPLPQGSRIVRYDPAMPEQGPINLTPTFSAAGRPQLSFDAERILFVGRRNDTEPLDVWQMDLDGSNSKRITTGADCTSVIHLSTLYTLDADQPAYHLVYCGRSKDEATQSLYIARMDGTGVQRITYNPGGVSDPVLLSDGRLLYSSRTHLTLGGSSFPASTLFTINTDGTGVAAFAAAADQPAIQHQPCETADGWVVFVESSGAPHDGGTLIAVRLTRSLRTRRIMASDRGGSYCSPSSLDAGRLLVSYRPGGNADYGLHVLDIQRGIRVAEIYDTPEWHEVDGFVVRPRPVPPGRSSVVDERAKTGLVYCLDTYLSGIENSRSAGQGDIQRLRILAAPTGGLPQPAGPAQPASLSTAPPFPEEILGTIPVESDGSFLVSVPARTPLRLETLDAGGQVLQSMRSYFWVMPKESRGCIGCHEDRELTPPNRHVLALRKPPCPIEPAGPARSEPAEPHQE